MPAHHVQVVLAVLADFAHGRVGEQRRQLRQRMGAVELNRGAGKVVAERQIRRLTWLGGHAQADQVGLQRVQAVGFGIESELAGGAQLRDPAVQLLLGQDGLVRARRRQRWIQVHRCIDRPGHEAGAARTARLGARGSSGSAQRHRLGQQTGLRQRAAQLAQRLGKPVARVQYR